MTKHWILSFMNKLKFGSITTQYICINNKNNDLITLTYQSQHELMHTIHSFHNRCYFANTTSITTTSIRTLTTSIPKAATFNLNNSISSVSTQPRSISTAATTLGVHAESFCSVPCTNHLKKSHGSPYNAVQHEC